jgi:hypothetical protein
VPATRYFATVDETGTRRSGTATGAHRVAQGEYNVAFNADLHRCSALVTPGTNTDVDGTANHVTAHVFPGLKFDGLIAFDVDNSVWIRTTTAGTTTRADSAFHVAVFC